MAHEGQIMHDSSYKPIKYKDISLLVGQNITIYMYLCNCMEGGEMIVTSLVWLVPSVTRILL